jgi:uncharacterized protein YndB with AHSA1/START domain
MFPTLAIVLVALVLIVLAVAAMKSPTFQVERHAHINAPTAKVFGLVEDFHAWATWSPWEKLDPNMTRTFTGAERGAGAVYTWVGNKQVGEGRMEILDATAPSKVTIKLDFIKPFAASNTTTFMFRPASGGTDVTWAMLGAAPFMFRVMSLFMSMDKMVGKDFEKGLANMKAVAEG